MEINISDLLDALPEVNVDIRPHTTASENRIKELTMRKIQANGKYQRKHRGTGFVVKLLIAAAIIAALAVPAMAASGTQFTDWIEGLLSPRTYEENFDNNLLVGSESKKWAVSGWVLEISSENSSKTGLTFVCNELGNPDKSGTLTTDQSYWLEQWDGSAYVPLEGTVSPGEVLTITDKSTERWHIDWTNIYGELSSGSYRIGKTFTYTATDGSQEQLSYYAKFRIFTQQMAPLLERQKQGYEELLNREVYHLSWTNYSTNKDDYAHRWVGEIWKHGDDYLEITSYYNEDGSLKSHRGYLLRDGIGYELFWADGNAKAQVTEWHNATWVEPGTFELWYSCMDLLPAILGEAREDNNTLYFLEYSDWKNEDMLSVSEIESLNESSPYWNHDYTELSYTFDNSGRICHMQYAKLRSLDPSESDPVISMELEVHDTPQEDIRAMIEGQNLGATPTFRWSEEQVTYADFALKREFINTSNDIMDTIQSVIDRARREADPKENPRYRDGYDYNQAAVFYDEAAGMWKVKFSHSQDDEFVLIVSLSADGVTQMLVHPEA